MRRGFAALAVCASAACGPIAMVTEPAPSGCRAPQPIPIRWVLPDDAVQREKLSAWCSAVGSAAHHEPITRISPSLSESLTVVSWNAAVGRGRLDDVLEHARSRYPDSDLVVLLQETYRTGGAPSECGPDSRRARRLGGRRRGEDVLARATALAMHAVYIPSMRNGEDCREEPREDRGNAILSTLPLAEIGAIELPLAQQRRVAVAASVRVGGRDVALVSVHFDTSPFAHQRQAKGLASGLASFGWDGPMIIGGDFNGSLPDPGIREMRKNFQEISCGDDPTHDFPALRLDRLFVRGAVRAASCVTSASSYGSDHWPLIARVVISDQGVGPTP